MHPSATNKLTAPTFPSTISSSSKMKVNTMSVPSALLLAVLAGDLLVGLRLLCAAQETFVFSIDLLEGETGYFKVEGYDGVQPTLTMIR